MLNPVPLQRCRHVWRQQSVDILGRPTPVARWVCERCDDATDADPARNPAGDPGSARSVPTFRGGSSWSFGQDGGSGLLEAVVHVRDAYALPVEPSPLAPPPLVAVPVARPWPGDDADRRRAGAQWSQWWRELVGAEQNGSPDDVDGRRSTALVDGPRFTSLDDRRELQHVVREGWPTARAACRPTPPVTIEWSLLAQIVDDIAFDRGVAPGDLHGRLVVVDVRGPWWALAAPAHAVTSRVGLDDPRFVHTLVRSVLESALGGPRLVP